MLAKLFPNVTMLRLPAPEAEHFVRAAKVVAGRSAQARVMMVG